MTEADGIVRELKRRNVSVHNTRAEAASAKKDDAAAVAFLGGAVLGGLIAAIVATENEDAKSEESG